jgi:hypothetical protein
MYILKMIVSWLFPASIVLYLYILMSLISKIKISHSDYWRNIGSPSSFDPNGQMRIIGLIFMSKNMPKYIFDAYKNRIYAIRFFFSLSLIDLVLILFMIKIGLYK